VDGIDEDVRDNSLTVDLGTLADKDGGFYIIKKTVKNPGSVVFGYIVCGILLLLLLWLFLLRPRFYPPIKVSKIHITEIGGFYGLDKSIRGYRKVVLSRENKKQNIFHRFFTGRVCYITDEIWSSDIEIEANDRGSVSLFFKTPFRCELGTRILKTTSSKKTLIVNKETNQRLEFFVS
jgi:hypothetical protein